MADKTRLPVPRELVGQIRRERADAKRKATALAAAEREAAKATRAHDRARARLSTASIHLMRRLDRIEKHPSPRAAGELRSIATDGTLPAEVRQRAASIALSWAKFTSEPPKAPKSHKKRGRPPKGNSNA